ncbi:tachykinin-like peptides receptor 86C, partial [Caerostris extrusa]
SLLLLALCAHECRNLLLTSIILSVWTLSSLLSLPSLLYATTITYKYADQGHRTLCYLVWPDQTLGRSYTDHVVIFASISVDKQGLRKESINDLEGQVSQQLWVFIMLGQILCQIFVKSITLYSLVVTYVIPMSCMAVTYTWIGRILWGSKVIGENADSQNHVIKSKQRVSFLFIFIGSSHADSYNAALCNMLVTLPHIFLYTYYNTDILQTHFIQHVYLAIYWLAMSNSCYNPIVYYIMNARFRGYFQEVVCMHRKLKPSEGLAFGETGRSLPPMARASIIMSNRTRSCRMARPCFKRECEPDYTGKGTSNEHEAAI